MKKILTVLVLFCATIVVSAQEVPSSFPRKFIIEHFTGDHCGYCPYGMYSIVEHIEKSSTPYVWVSHHYGYNEDEYTIPESEYIGKFIYPHDNVNTYLGAPNMVLNRTKIYGKTMHFHPAYLVEEGFDEIIKSKLDTTAEASVNINHTYNADTRELNITVSGQVANTTTTEYLLTVLVKENGLIGKQADYYWSWKTAGWKEFMHPCVLRGFISNHFGDNVAVENQAYSKTFTYTVSEKWVAENCNIVAYITPLDKKPIINAEETPLVAGTTGGTEYVPFAITENKEPNNAGKLKFDSFTLSKPSEDKLELQLIASSTTRYDISDIYTAVRMVATLEFNTKGDIIPTDTLDYVAGDELNTFTAGHVDLVSHESGGSRLEYIADESITTDNWISLHTWRIKSGRFLLDKNGGFFTSGKLDNNKNFQITVTLPAASTEKVIFNEAHIEKLMREGQIIIRIDDTEYDMQGRVITQ